MPSHTPRERAKKVSRKIIKLKKEGKSQKQSIAIAINISRKPKKKK